MQRWQNILDSYGPGAHRYHLVTQTVTQGSMSNRYTLSLCKGHPASLLFIQTYHC